MSSDNTIENILEEIYQMALRKKKKNETLPDGEKIAEMVRVRFGTRLPVYLPQRVTDKLAGILGRFRDKASKIGIRQFVIQTHFESAMEITPEARSAVEKLNAAGWIVTNQLVFTTAASRRGHSAKLRKEMNDIGILPYYTFTVKGYMENNFCYTPNARIVQEELEEKSLGRVDARFKPEIEKLVEEPTIISQKIARLRNEADVPFLAIDRNVLNLPGVGKSMTFRTIGVTRYGRRILQFDHDSTRSHSPITEKMGKIIIIESKSIHEYLNQMEELGEKKEDYDGLYGYSMGQTEERPSIYEYPEYGFELTGELSNIDI
jgi:lysine 2,3-aminomutase